MLAGVDGCSQLVAATAFCQLFEDVSPVPACAEDAPADVAVAAAMPIVTMLWFCTNPLPITGTQDLGHIPVCGGLYGW